MRMAEVTSGIECHHGCDRRNQDKCQDKYQVIRTEREHDQRTSDKCEE